MKKLLLMLVLFSLTTSAQEKLNHQEKKLYFGYKKAGDKAYREGKYGKASAEYRKADQLCHNCVGIKSMIDSCNAHNKASLAPTKKTTTAPAPAKTASTEEIQYAEQSAEMKALASHGQLTQFSNMNYNFVSSRVQTYLSKYLNMSPDSNDVTDESITLLFREKSAYNTPQKELTFKFRVTTSGNDFIIQDCTITGDTKKLMDFYLYYWNTNLKLDETKTGLVATTKLLQDDSKLYLNGDKSYIEVARRAE